MARVASLPFRTSDADAVKMSAWRIVAPDGVETELKDEIGGWDYSMNIVLRTEVAIDTNRVVAGCSLGRDTRMSFLVSWHSIHSQMRGLGFRHEMTSDGPVELTIEFEIPGEALAVSVDLVSTLVLVETSGEPEALAPRLAGSRLWESRTRYHLEGSGSRFPMQVIDFERLGIPSAGWKLSWSPTNMEAPYQHGLVLNINAKNELMMHMLQDADDVLHHILMFDIGRQLVTGALMSEDFVMQHRSYDDGSVGKAILGLINACFPDQGISDLANHYRQEPSEIEGQLQHSLKILGE